MHITGFSRIDTVTVPDKFMAVIHLSEDGEEADADQIRTTLETDKESLDYLGVDSDSDPLSSQETYKLIKSVKPRGMKVLIVTDGRDPSILDDLVGAGYVHAANILIGKSLTDEQKDCIEILKDNGCKFAITLNAKEHDADSVKAVGDQCKGCSMIVFRQDRKDPLKKSEMSSLVSAAKGCTWNVKTN